MASKLIDKVYEYTSSAGNAHIVFDDWNIEDYNIDFCIKDADKDEESSKDQIAAEKNALVYFLKLSEEERLSALAIQEGFLNSEVFGKGK